MSSVYVTSSILKTPPRIFVSDFFETPQSIKRREMEIKHHGHHSRYAGDTCHAVWLGHWGSITIVDRMTGYGFGIRDVETGYTGWDVSGKWSDNFWLVSCNFDIRDLIPEEGIEADKLIAIIKDMANNCIGKYSFSPAELK